MLYGWMPEKLHFVRTALAPNTSSANFQGNSRCAESPPITSMGNFQFDRRRTLKQISVNFHAAIKMMLTSGGHLASSTHPCRMYSMIYCRPQVNGPGACSSRTLRGQCAELVAEKHDRSPALT
jgi:hypothetical protein